MLRTGASGAASTATISGSEYGCVHGAVDRDEKRQGAGRGGLKSRGDSEERWSDGVPEVEKGDPLRVMAPR